MKRLTVLRVWSDVDLGVLGEVMKFDQPYRMIAGYAYRYSFFGKRLDYLVVSDEAITREEALRFATAHAEGRFTLRTIDMRGV